MVAMVMFNGAFYTVDRMSTIQLLGEDITEAVFTVLYELHPVEPAQPFLYYNCPLVPRGSFIFMPSSIDFSDSEWSQGVKNGKTK